MIDPSLTIGDRLRRERDIGLNRFTDDEIDRLTGKPRPGTSLIPTPPPPPPNDEKPPYQNLNPVRNTFGGGGEISPESGISAFNRVLNAHQRKRILQDAMRRMF